MSSQIYIIIYNFLQNCADQLCKFAVTVAMTANYFLLTMPPHQLISAHHQSGSHTGFPGLQQPCSNESFPLLDLRLASLLDPASLSMLQPAALGQPFYECSLQTVSEVQLTCLVPPTLFFSCNFICILFVCYPTTHHLL